MGCTRISYTLTKLALWAALLTVNFQHDRSTLRPASTTSKFLSIVSIVREKDRHMYEQAPSTCWKKVDCTVHVCATQHELNMQCTIPFRCVYLLYTHLNTLYIKKYQRNSIHTCRGIHYLLHGSIIKCFHLLKRKQRS